MPQVEVFKGNFEVFNLTTNLKGFKRTYNNKSNTFLVRRSFRGPWNLSLILCPGFQRSRSHTALHTTKMTALRHSLQFKSLTQTSLLLLGLNSQQTGMFMGGGRHVKEISSVNFPKSSFLEIRSSGLYWRFFVCLFVRFLVVTLLGNVHIVYREAWRPFAETKKFLLQPRNWEEAEISPLSPPLPPFFSSSFFPCFTSFSSLFPLLPFLPGGKLLNNLYSNSDASQNHRMEESQGLVNSNDRWWCPSFQSRFSCPLANVK